MQPSDDPDTYARSALRIIGPDPANWVPDRPGIDHNVAIIGGGQSGSALTFALRRAGIGKVTILEAAPDEQHTGIWLTAARMNMLNPLTLPWLEAAGAAPKAVTHVVQTHMHSDHVGWNTVLADGRWVPTFPNARYLMPRGDFDYYRDEAAQRVNPIIDQAFANGWVDSKPPARLTGKTVAVVGSGPAGLAAAQQLTRAGHTVAVFERDDRIGGLLRYGIPDFKMEKRHLEARLRQMQDEGTRFRAGVTIGTDISWSDLRSRYDAVVIATGSTIPRDLAIPGRDLDGVHFAMEYLVESNKAVAGDQVPHQISAEGKHVIVIGGGDTGADCIGTAHRQGALSVTNLAIGTQPPTERPAHQPWPMTPTVFEVSSAHEEGGERMFLASTV